EGSVWEYSEIGGCILEHARVGVDPDAKRSRLAERHHSLARPGDRNDDVVAAAPRSRRRILLYSAEQHELFAGEVRCHHYSVIGQGSDQPLASSGRNRYGERAERSEEGKWGRAPHVSASNIRME